VTGFVDLDREDLDSLINGTIDERRALPAYGLTYRPLEGMSVRLAYSETVARPSFREMGYYVSVEQGSDDKVIGNPQLQLSDVESWDARWEYTWGDFGDLAAVSVFKKDIQKPIESIVLRAQDDLSATSAGQFRTFFNNPNDAEVRGIELEARKNLAFLGPALAEYFSVGGNYTYIHAEVDRTEAELSRSLRFFQNAGQSVSFPELEETRRLYGQPEWIGNVDLSFDQREWGTKITLALFMISDILDAAGAAQLGADRRVEAYTLDRYIDSYEQLDLILSQTWNIDLLGGDIVFKASIKNLTNSTRRVIYDPYQTASDIPEREYEVGQDYAFSVGYKLEF
jgi:outer membrane receptor protein involved in Fe transport